MKRIVFAAIALISTSVLAEPSFDQVERLIEQHQYSAAASGLEEIIRNHPNQPKPYYAMAQAQAGLGNLERAKHALDKATGLDPSLSFASSENVERLRQAITPQVAKIDYVDDSHTLRNAFLFILFAGAVIGAVLWYEKNKKKKAFDDDEDDFNYAYRGTEPRRPVSPSGASVTPKYSAPASGTARPTYHQPSSYAHIASGSQSPTIINNNHGSNDLLTGMLIGDMLNSHHDHTTIIEREIHTPIDPSWDDDLERIKKLSNPALDASWDSTASSSKSSSWDSDTSSSLSSSWDSDSSSSRSSSWDSSSSSSSSWDSGSSSSDSSWDSGSSSSD